MYTELNPTLINFHRVVGLGRLLPAGIPREVSLLDGASTVSGPIPIVLGPLDDSGSKA